MVMRTDTSAYRVKHIDPDNMMKNSAYTQVIEVSGQVRTIYISGQNAVDRLGKIVGKGDVGVQTEQIMKNLSSALRAVGAGLEDMIKCTICLVHGQPSDPVRQAYLSAWGDRPNPPTISLMYVAGLARPEFLAEIDAIAVAPL